MPFDLSPLAAIWMALAVFGAAFVRGYSGFGFSALVVAAAALVTNPLSFVAVVLFCEMILSLQAWRGIRGEIDWRRVWLLLAGAAIGMPLGIWALLSISETAARAAISGFVLFMCLVLTAGWRMARPAEQGATFGAGVVSGLANAPGMGGLPVAAFFAAQPIAPAVFRATLVAYFPALDLMAIPLYAASGMISADTFLATVLSLPLLFLGNALGAWRFRRGAVQDFRHLSILLLSALALSGLGKSLYELLVAIPA